MYQYLYSIKKNLNHLLTLGFSQEKNELIKSLIKSVDQEIKGLNFINKGFQNRTTIPLRYYFPVEKELEGKRKNILMVYSSASEYRVKSKLNFWISQNERFDTSRLDRTYKFRITEILNMVNQTIQDSENFISIKNIPITTLDEIKEKIIVLESFSNRLRNYLDSTNSYGVPDLIKISWRIKFLKFISFGFYKTIEDKIIQKRKEFGEFCSTLRLSGAPDNLAISTRRRIRNKIIKKQKKLDDFYFTSLVQENIHPIDKESFEKIRKDLIFLEKRWNPD